MSEVTGVVENIQNPNQWGKYAVCVNGEWYSTNMSYAPKCTVNQGDTVTFDNGGKKYINRLSVVSSGGASTPAPAAKAAPAATGFPVGPLDRNRAINRQNALTNAVTAYNNFNSSGGCTVIGTIEAYGDSVILLAKQFEAYTTGDLDVEEAEAMVKEMGIK